MSKTVLATMNYDSELQEAIQSPLQDLAELVFLQDLPQDQRAGALAGADAVLTYMFGKELLPDEPGLINKDGLLQSITAGAEHLPYGKFPSGLTICCNAGAWSGPLAESALGMVISLAKRFRAQRTLMSRGEWVRSYTYVLRGRTLGIIGFGGIGQDVARVFAPLDMRLMALNRSGKTDKQVDFIGTMDDLDKVLSQADVLVVSTPLTNQTRGLIGPDQLARMKDEAILINLARGAIIQQEALYDHLAAHPDFMFGSDVWWDEPKDGAPLSLKRPFFELPNVMGTPHNADRVEGSLGAAARIAAGNVARFLKGKPLHGVVNPAEYI